MSSLEGFFNPKSVVIVGASRTPGKIGYELLKIMVENSQRGMYKGKLYAVNPKSEESILGVPTFKSVTEIPDTPDLAVLVTPAKYTPLATERPPLSVPFQTTPVPEARPDAHHDRAGTRSCIH